MICFTPNYLFALAVRDPLNFTPGEENNKQLFSSCRQCCDTSKGAFLQVERRWGEFNPGISICLYGKSWFCDQTECRWKAIVKVYSFWKEQLKQFHTRKGYYQLLTMKLLMADVDNCHKNKSLPEYYDIEMCIVSPTHHLKKKKTD